MKSWLKFFGLSFFSDKIAKEARTRGVFNCVLGFAFALLFIFCGVLAANTAPFYTHYKNASDFKAFVYNAADKAALSVENARVSADKTVNTFLSEADAEVFGGNGYNLVIDTRPSEAYDNFEAYCVLKSGEGEIAYEEYLALTEEDKAAYDFKIRYTPEELVLTDGLIADYESFLSGREDFSSLSEKKGEMETEAYKKAVYELYLKAYYPAFTSSERTGVIPLLRSYYYVNYLTKSDMKNALFIFDDVLFGYFTTDGGVEVTFFGSYESVPQGVLTADSADSFVKEAFSSSVSTSTNVYLMTIFRFIPFIAAIPVILALVAKIALTLFKDTKYKKYTTCLKIEFAYLAVGSLISALITFICGYFLSSGLLNMLPMIILAAVIAVRTVAFIVYEYFVNKKQS